MASRCGAAWLGAVVLASACVDGVRFVPLPRDLSTDVAERGTTIVRRRDEPRVWVGSARALRLDELEPPFDVFFSREPPERLGLVEGAQPLFDPLAPDTAPRRALSGLRGFTLAPEVLTWTPLPRESAPLEFAPIVWAAVIDGGGCSARSRDDDTTWAIEPRCPAPVSPVAPEAPRASTWGSACGEGFADTRTMVSTTTHYPSDYLAPDRELTRVRRLCRVEYPVGCAADRRVPGRCLGTSARACADPPADAIVVDPGAAAGGDGTAAHPFASIDAAVAAGHDRLTLARGRHVTPRTLPATLTLVGVCSAEVQLALPEGQTSAARLVLSALTLEATRLDAAVTLEARQIMGSRLELAGDATLDEVELHRLVVGPRATVRGTNSRFGDVDAEGRLTLEGSAFGVLTARGATLALSRSVIEAGLALDGGVLTLADVEGHLDPASTGAIAPLRADRARVSLTRVALFGEAPFFARAAVSIGAGSVADVHDLAIVAPPINREQPGMWGRGVEVAAAARATIAGLWVEGMGTFGVFVALGGDAALEDASVLAAGSLGLSVEGALTVRRALIAGGAGNAIGVRASRSGAGSLTLEDLTALWNHAAPLSVGGEATLARVAIRGSGDGALVVGPQARVRHTDLAVTRVSQSACVGRCAAAILVDPSGHLDLERFTIESTKRVVRLYAGADLRARQGLLTGLDAFTFDDGDEPGIVGLAPSLEGVRVEVTGSAVTETAP